MYEIVKEPKLKKGTINKKIKYLECVGCGTIFKTDEWYIRNDGSVGCICPKCRSGITYITFKSILVKIFEKRRK